MQRQSLGSSSSSIISPSSPEHEAEEKKVVDRSSDHRLIHLIPLLAILCFLILYLSSHHPQHAEMAEFNKKLQNHIDRIDEMEAVMETKKGDIVVIQSLRNLQEIDKEEGRPYSKYHQVPRKIGDF